MEVYWMQEHRKLLQKNTGVCDTFTGIFERKGTKNGWKGRKEKTVLLKNIVDKNGTQVAEHLKLRNFLVYRR